MLEILKAVPDDIPEGVSAEDIPIYLAAMDFHAEHPLTDIYAGVPEDTRKFGDYFIGELASNTLDRLTDFAALSQESKELFFAVLEASWISGWKSAQGIPGSKIGRAATDD